MTLVILLKIQSFDGVGLLCAMGYFVLGKKFQSHPCRILAFIGFWRKKIKFLEL